MEKQPVPRVQCLLSMVEGKQEASGVRAPPWNRHLRRKGPVCWARGGYSGTTCPQSDTYLHICTYLVDTYHSSVLHVPNPHELVTD